MGIAKIGGVDIRVFSGTAGETLAAYDACYLSSNGKYYKTRSDLMTEGSQEPASVMAAAVILADAVGNFWGPATKIMNPAWALTVGQQVYAGWNPGAITQTLPSLDFTTAMTANNLPAPLVASADSEASGHEAYKGFDGSVATYWGPSSGNTGWLKLDFGVGRTMQYYSLAVPALSYAEEIEAISRANPAVITMTGHGLVTGNHVAIHGITQTGWTWLNTGLSSNGYSWPVTYVDDNSFSVLFDSRGAAAIEDASKAAACVITLANHSLTIGSTRSVVIAGITQADWTALNGTRTATIINANTFSVAVNTSAFALTYDPGTDPGTVDTSGIDAVDYVPATDPGTIALRNELSAWTLAGSNNDADWTTLDTQSSQNSLSSTPTNYLIASPASYRYLRLTVSAGLGATLQLAEMAFQLLENYLQVLGIATAATAIQFNPNSLEIGVA